jgi:hypothetical protein
MYPMAIAAKAANIPPKKQRRWLDTGVVPLRSNDRKAHGSGNYCGFSRNRVLQTAITQHLLSIGVSLSTAAKAALQFSDFGQTGRAAGELFQHGKTLLVIGPDGTTVQNALFDASLADLSRRGVSFIIVDLNKIVAQIDATLKESFYD